MALPKHKIVARPESEQKLVVMVQKLLREADAIGVLPTPVERLFEIIKVTSVDALPDDTFLASLNAKARSVFKGAWQKLRGVADLRAKAAYIPKDPHSGRELFAKGHELGHHTIPWHNIDPAYLDDNETLGAEAKAVFEIEANYFSSQTIFQVDRFRTMARDYQPSFDAIFALADQYGASKHATAWRFVEDQDEPVALLQYYPGHAIDEHGNPVLTLWRSVGSPKFNQRFADIDVPMVIRTGHPWVGARDFALVFDGNENLLVDGHAVTFKWHAWWNSYALFVLIRRRPVLSVVGGWLGND